MLTFCTLFDSGYLSRGLALYFSLERHCTDFHLYIFAFDDDACRILRAIDLKHATIVSLSEFEDEELLRVKPSRSRGEYCWTSTSSTIKYVLDHYHTDHCTYLDSDLYFYASPLPLIEEMKGASVSIIPHRYSPAYDQSSKTGIYCVQFMTFKRTPEGMEVLNWWRNRCLEWCYNRMEEGRFGDQKYLDDWTERFPSVCVLQNLGGGIAPWNMQQYVIVESNGGLKGVEKHCGKGFEPIFYHFHSLTFVSPSFFSPRPYYQREASVIDHLFTPYIKEIVHIRNRYPDVAMKERYLGGFAKLKYLAELFVRRGFGEWRYIKKLRNK